MLKLFVGPGEKLTEIGHERLRQEVDNFRAFLHTYLHGKAIETLDISFKGKFGGGVTASVSAAFTSETRPKRTKRIYR